MKLFEIDWTDNWTTVPFFITCMGIIFIFAGAFLVLIGKEKHKLNGHIAFNYGIIIVVVVNSVRIFHEILKA